MTRQQANVFPATATDTRTTVRWTPACATALTTQWGTLATRVLTDTMGTLARPRLMTASRARAPSWPRMAAPPDLAGATCPGPQSPAPSVPPAGSGPGVSSARTATTATRRA